MKRVLIHNDIYADSVFLMLLSRELKKDLGVTSVSVIMGTPNNLGLLKDQGFMESELALADANDLVIALDCQDEKTMESVIADAEDFLCGKLAEGRGKKAFEYPTNLSEALSIQRSANIAVISVPGQYAAYEARMALKKGLHVLLFSDNVSIEDEIDLKRLGKEKGLLVMGPDCGTAILGGQGLCFANSVSQGPIGIVAASGTGIQEVSCLLDRYGTGVSQAIGTGGRDLQYPEIGGTTMLMGIAALSSDPQTKVIVIISKPPENEIAGNVITALEKTGKPSVVYFLGTDVHSLASGPSIHFANNLEETARLAANLVDIPVVEMNRTENWPFDFDFEYIDALVKRETAHMSTSQKYLRGLYTGGTLASEAVSALSDLNGGVWSNKQTDPALMLNNPYHSIAHSIIDLGDDLFTVGKPHPMIDPIARTERIEAEMQDPTIAVMLFDCILGNGSHEDPATVLSVAIAKAKQVAKKRGGYLSVIVSVTGTDKDFQNRTEQIARLEHEMAIVMPSNYQAVRLAKRILLREFGPKTLHVQTYSHRLSSRSLSLDSGQSIPDSSLILSLFLYGPNAVNLGLEAFSRNLNQSLQVSWNPPGRGNIRSFEALTRIERMEKIDRDAANTEAVGRVLDSVAMLQGIGRAGDVVPGMRKNLVLHAGPPLDWSCMCGPMRGAVIGALMYENLAKTPEQAIELAASGEIDFEPCHNHKSVGPMAGIMTESMPVWMVQNKTFGNMAYATLNEGLGKVLRYGAYSPEVLEKLRWMETTLAPVLQKALTRHGPINLKNLIANALMMGDECHNRNKAATSLFIRELAPDLVLLDEDREVLSKIFESMHSNDHFFLNISMAAAKCTMDAATSVEGSTLVTAMARNGTEFGIKISSMKDRWFTGPASVVEGLYLPGFSSNDAALDIGDSVITETAGLGAFAMAASPAIVAFVGGKASDAIDITKRMYRITLAENVAYRLPSLDFRGNPTGIDIVKIVETGVLPVINTGIAHKESGKGMVGAGMVKPPLNCFVKAVLAYADTYCSI
jgi:succinyl-CoA synthetase alpha subunit